jgi:hypothetical protein
VGPSLWGQDPAQVAVQAVQIMMVDSVIEAVNDFLSARQCVTIYPMKIGPLPLIAGILGHQGCVIGDEPSMFDQLVTHLTEPDLAFRLSTGMGVMATMASFFGIKPHHYENLIQADEE